METKKMFFLLLLLAVVVMGCSKETEPVNPTEATTQLRNGAIQINGIGEFAGSECDYVSEGADFALSLEGDLEGCVFVYVLESTCTPSGAYRESGLEYFVGTYNGEYGTFWTTYNFEARYEDCENGVPSGAQYHGRCQHPIQEGSGTDIFEGASGILFFKDDVQAGNFPYRGHLLYQ